MGSPVKRPDFDCFKNFLTVIKKLEHQYKWTQCKLCEREKEKQIY